MTLELPVGPSTPIERISRRFVPAPAPRTWLKVRVSAVVVADAT